MVYTYYVAVVVVVLREQLLASFKRGWVDITDGSLDSYKKLVTAMYKMLQIHTSNTDPFSQASYLTRLKNRNI